jgi:16S rRNA (guanine527-N7)-methyltransferase
MEGVFHVKHEGWDVLAGLGLELAGEQIATLERYERLLVDRAAPAGMIAGSDLPRLRERHVLDCLRAVPLVPPADALCDLGSGAGLPGIPIAIARPDLRIILVEVRRNRAAFLESTVADLHLPHVTVHGRRSETLRESVDVCTARAYAPPGKSWEAAQRLLAPQGRLIYWAGATFDPHEDVPAGVAVALFPSVALARSGVLAIMGRQ